jgi:hypothetical protein
MSLKKARSPSGMWVLSSSRQTQWSAARTRYQESGWHQVLPQACARVLCTTALRVPVISRQRA